MNNLTMTETLARHHATIRAGIAEIRQQCSNPVPDICALGMARFRLSRSSAARTRYVSEQVLPFLNRSHDARLHDEIAGMLRAFMLKRLRSSEHVAAWTAATIEGDWEGYKAASREIIGMMECQMSREAQVLMPQLRIREGARP